MQRMHFKQYRQIKTAEKCKSGGKNNQRAKRAIIFQQL